jgi:4-hydroxybenzoate polyprenyltransferase
MTSNPQQDAESGSEHPIPLVVDLDGTLVCTDLLLESVFLLAKRKPLSLWRLPFWLARGRAFLKRRLAEEAMPDVHGIPYHPELLANLMQEKRQGRQLVLASAADERVARAVTQELDLFDTVFASDGETNLSGQQKRDRLVGEFGAKGFDYAGNSRRDLPVWRAARKAILVRPSHGLSKAVAESTEVERVYVQEHSGLLTYLRALRPYQWIKNVLVFVPLAAAHQLYEWSLLTQALLAFAAFSLCASAVYLINDLIDLPADRGHPHKKQRPLASGQLPIARAAASIPLLLAVAASLGMLLPPGFLGVLGFYLVLMLAYSLRLKDQPIVDVLVLAGGYALRVMSGALAVAIAPSPWLLAFCIFLFFSLALIKRYAELATMSSLNGGHGRARAYVAEDSNLLASFGVASGYLSVLVLALYIGTDHVSRPYGRYEFIWLFCILQLYWISYLWLMAHRGRIHDDPLLFALKDNGSRILLLIMAATLLLVI